jgi:hypothetical protein
MLALAVLAATTGCVERRMTVRTNPPGALVYVDNVEIGTTPVSHRFLYYGTREIRLVKAGYETMTVMQPIATPWYQIPPFDFVADNLAPWEVRDEREFIYQMVPVRNVPTDEIMSRAEQLRGGVLSNAPAVGPPVITPGPAVVAPPSSAPGMPSAPPVLPSAPPVLPSAPPVFPSAPPVVVPGPSAPVMPGFPPPGVPIRPRRSWPTPDGG